MFFCFPSDKDGPEYVVEDKHSEMKHILAPLNLYFSKHQKYPLLLVHKNYRLNFSKSFFRDNTTRFQLSNGDSFAKKYEFHVRNGLNYAKILK